MRWFQRDHPDFAGWRVNGHTGEATTLVDEEACTADCPKCLAALCVVIQFRDLSPQRILMVTREEDWPAEYNQ